MLSTAFYNISTVGYVFSLAVFSIHLVKTKKNILRLGLAIVALSFIVQTFGLIFRWAEAGVLEVKAFEKAIGSALSGWSYFVVFTQHPPWSNLYEIMIYMSWGIILLTLFAEIKWELPFIRQVGILLCLVSLGMASLTDASIAPLVPALKSYWIMIHVISASVAYSAGALAAFMCLFALIKDEKHIKTNYLLGFSLLFLGLLLFCVGGGPNLFSTAHFYVKLLAFSGNEMVNAIDLSKGENANYLTPMPLGGPLILLSMGIHLSFGICMILKETIPKNMLRKLYVTAFISLLSVLVLMIYHGINQTIIEVPTQLQNHLMPQGPFFIGFKSYPWSFGLMILAVSISAIFVVYLFNKHLIFRKLPSVTELENIAKKTISLSFFLMTIVLVTGCLWAHYAWGRYWAWDPKETGALAIWITYAIYLHTKRTKGLSGPVSSFIGVLGLFVIIIGFLGVNLGLFAEGLHTYGNS